MHPKPFKILGIEHVGIAVNELNGVSDFFSKTLGLDFIGSENVEDQKVITDIYKIGASKIEFLKSTEKSSPIDRFIKKRGTGIHHIALKVDNLLGALDYFKSKGIELIDSKPRIGAEGLMIAFLHPNSTGGILIELCEIK